MHAQSCPVCLHAVDVSIFVTGQTVRCKRCRNKFVVERSDAAPEAAGDRRATPMAVPRVSIPPDTRNDRARLATPMAAPVAAAPAPAPVPAPLAATAAPTDATEPLPVVPGYTMLKKQGEGAMGSVWKAIHDDTGEVVALKFLVAHLAKYPDFISRFEREARAMEVSQSPYVVRLRGRGDHGGVYYIIMEFIEGYPLRNEMAQLARNPGRAVGICRRIARGLQAMHNAGVRHRDLKPENVLMGQQGEVKIVDFGLAGMAREVDPHPNLTKTRVTMGTMNYMAPEQRVDAKRVDARADIFSLGVMLFEMLTGELPTGIFKFPHERGLPGVPPYTDVLLRKALAHEPVDRHRNAEELDADLKQLENILRNPQAEDPNKRRWWPFA